MLRKTWDAFRSWMERKKKRRAKRSAPVCDRWTRLCVEQLERREVLSTLLWIGPNNGNSNFSNANNWIDEFSHAFVAPAANDNLEFDPGKAIAGINGADTNAVDDEPAILDAVSIGTSGRPT